ncbi:general stress protein [Peribacillus cavernae]|nr:general stress protein [Peribacillus cavernae]MDQ0220186.1 putative membrane protein [Peribacillus cavernae]
MEKKVVGVFHNVDEVIRSINSLKDQGYTSDDISLITKEKKEFRDISEETDTKIEKAAVTGAATGGFMGAIAGLLAGIGALAIPGVGPIIAAGPILATLGGATAGAGAGRLVGALVGMGISEHEANEYVNYIKQGDILLLVDTDADREKGIHVTLRPKNALNSSYHNSSST